MMEELDDINVPQEKMWTQATLFTCDVTNKSVTTLTEGGKSPYELWFGKAPIPGHLRPFGAEACARRSVREHKVAPKGEKWAFMGIPRDFPSGTVSLLLVTTRKIVERQAVQWIDGPDKTGSMGVDDEDLGVKSSENESGVIRGVRRSTCRGWSRRSSRHHMNANRRCLRRCQTPRRKQSAIGP